MPYRVLVVSELGKFTLFITLRMHNIKAGYGTGERYFSGNNCPIVVTFPTPIHPNQAHSQASDIELGNLGQVSSQPEPSKNLGKECSDHLVTLLISFPD
ncbi:hypothetical protein FRC12_020003 [Ceratobasidium sp. 428]|nr:hypothetical protein FRC12_020003 [Ceratobasidium sp. 428]